MAKRPQTLIACPAQKWGQLTNQASFTNFANCLWFHRRPVCLGLFGLSCVFAQIAACGELSHCPLPVSHFPFPMPSWVSHFRAWECHLLPGSGTTRFIWLLQSIVVGFFAPRSLLSCSEIACFRSPVCCYGFLDFSRTTIILDLCFFRHEINFGSLWPTNDLCLCA